MKASPQAGTYTCRLSLGKINGRHATDKRKDALDINQACRQDLAHLNIRHATDIHQTCNRH